MVQERSSGVLLELCYRRLVLGTCLCKLRLICLLQFLNGPGSRTGASLQKWGIKYSASLSCWSSSVASSSTTVTSIFWSLDNTCQQHDPPHHYLENSLYKHIRIYVYISSSWWSYLHIQSKLHLSGAHGPIPSPSIACRENSMDPVNLWIWVRKPSRTKHSKLNLSHETSAWLQVM